MTNDEHGLIATELEGAGRAPIPEEPNRMPTPLLCCSAVPTLRRMELSVAFACRLCTRIGEPARSELAAVAKWNRDLRLALPGLD